jgi:hypothetical protein
VSALAPNAPGYESRRLAGKIKVIGFRKGLPDLRQEINMTLAGLLEQSGMRVGFPKLPGTAKRPDERHQQDGEQAAEKK